MCISDPDVCANDGDQWAKTHGFTGLGLSYGFSVSFWIKISYADLRIGQSDTQYKHQYFISSGGQVSNSRGWSFLYAADESKFKLQLQTMQYVYMIEFAETQIPETWSHICFTWSAGGKYVISFSFIFCNYFIIHTD